MRTYDKIKDMLCDELDEIAKKNELTSSNLDVIYKAVDVIKDLTTVEAMEQEGYSNDGYSGRYPYYHIYDDGNSYTRKRDSMGRYSRDDGYSRDSMKDELRQMMDRAKSDKEREALRKAMDSMM